MVAIIFESLDKGTLRPHPTRQVQRDDKPDKIGHLPFKLCNSNANYYCYSAANGPSDKLPSPLTCPYHFKVKLTVDCSSTLVLYSRFETNCTLCLFNITHWIKTEKLYNSASWQFVFQLWTFSLSQEGLKSLMLFTFCLPVESHFTAQRCRFD